MDSTERFIIENGLLTDYRGPGGEVTLPEGVRELGYGALGGAEITALTLPESLEELGDMAFMGLASLERIALHRGIRRIGSMAFYGCASLREIEIPEGVEEIAARAFSGCGELVRVLLPGTLREIGSGAFSGCGKLREIALPEGLEVLGQVAFTDCGALPEIALPESLRSIGDNAFNACEGLALITLPEEVEKVGYAPFAYCRAAARLRRWNPCHSALLQNCALTAVITEEPESVPAQYREALALGYAARPEKDGNSLRAKRHAEFFTEHAAALCAAAFDHPELLEYLCANRLIPPGDADAYLREAESREDAEAKALLLEYQHDLGLARMEEARALREEEAERYGEEWMDRAMRRDPSAGVAGMRFAVEGSHRLRTALGTIAVLLEQRGAVLDTDVGPQTDYLVTDEPEGATEHHLRAARLGVPLLSEQEFRAMLGVTGDQYLSSFSISWA